MAGSCSSAKPSIPSSWLIPTLPRPWLGRGHGHGATDHMSLDGGRLGSTLALLGPGRLAAVLTSYLPATAAARLSCDYDQLPVWRAVHSGRDRWLEEILGFSTVVQAVEPPRPCSMLRKRTSRM
eukprot:scaffold2419_cov114-Isochrysis_galbana.AAC.3